MGNAINKEEFQGSGSGSQGSGLDLQGIGNPPIPCPPGTYGGTTGQTSSQCSGKCSAGYYCTAGSTLQNQHPCPSGFYCLEGTGDPLSSNPPAPCAAGTSSSSGASSCTACESGKSSRPGELCGPCAAGTYSRNTCPPRTVFTSEISPKGPQSLPPEGVQMWYDGNDFDGDGIQGYPDVPWLEASVWKDKSGYRRHATTSQSPTPSIYVFQSNAPTKSGAMSFNKSQRTMAEASYGDNNLFSTALHMFVVVKENHDAGTEPTNTTPISFGHGSIFDPFDNRRTIPGSGIDVHTSNNSAFNITLQKNITIWEVLIYQASQSTSYYKEWYNGVPVTFDPTNAAKLTGFTPTNSTNTFYIANRNPISSGNYDRSWTGFIFDIVIYNRALPTAEREMVQGFLAWKWGIQSALPLLHPYQLVSPPITNLVSAPMKPVSLTTAISPSGLVVNWLGGEGASSYIITLNSSINTYNIVVSGANIYTRTLSTIQPGIPYTLTVTAVNRIGSTPSDSIEVTYFLIQVATVAGNSGPGSSRIDGVATQFIYNPSAIVSDSCGSLFVADANNYIRKIYIKKGSGSGSGSGSASASVSGSGTSSMVTTFVGDGSTGFTNSGSTSSFNRPQGLAIDTEDNIYVADTYNHCIRKISPQGEVTTLAGSGSAGMRNNDTGTIAMFYFPMALAVDYTGAVYVADRDNNRIRKISPSGAVTTFAGSGMTGSQDGIGTVATFTAPCGIAVDSFGNVYVADTGNHLIRKITPSGVVTTVAGFGGITGLQDGTGRCARFNTPVSISIDSNGTLYVCEKFNHAIRKIVLISEGSGTATAAPAAAPAPASCSTTNGDTATVTTIAGNGSAGSVNGVSFSSKFNTPNALCFDPIGIIYVADTLNNTIRMITITPLVTPAQPRTCVTLCKPCCVGTTSTPGSFLCTPSATF